jgi:hypothetical protein
MDPPGGSISSTGKAVGSQNEARPCMNSCNNKCYRYGCLFNNRQSHTIEYEVFIVAAAVDVI